MKFSYALIKKLVPALKNKSQLIEALNVHSFETVDAGGDVFDVSVPPNRYSDSASHLGVAREAAAVLNLRFEYKKIRSLDIPKSNLLKINIKDEKLCRRYAAGYFSNIKIKSSSPEIKKILTDCGLRPINNVVDIMNYAMLETGQPLHAFDADKLERTAKGKGQIAVRRAKNNEIIETLDNAVFKLNSDVLVIADAESPLAIAGIKGGKKAEVDDKTKNIIVEAANFDSVNIYRTSSFLNLKTDASIRFAHGLNPASVDMGLEAAARLLKKETNAKLIAVYDSQTGVPPKKIIEFDVQRFNKLIGVDLYSAQAADYLRRLGFFIKTDIKHLIEKNSFLAEIPLIREDVENFEDLVEEVVRLFGYDNLKPAAPSVILQSAESDDIVILKDQLKRYLIGLGFSEVYNYSFISEKEKNKGDFWDGSAPEIANPISSEFQFLRSNLAIRLLKNIADNFRFLDEVKIFEIGKVFNKEKESYRLGLALVSKNKETIFELKGAIAELFEKIGLSDYFTSDIGNTLGFLQKSAALRLESDHSVIGYLGKANMEMLNLPAGGYVSLAEIDLDKLLALIEGERSFKILPKYPAVARDLSIIVNRSYRIGEIMEILETSAFKYAEDIDFIDEYESKEFGEDRQSLTFRIIFRSNERTLEDGEINLEMEKIVKILEDKFQAEIT